MPNVMNLKLWSTWSPLCNLGIDFIIQDVHLEGVPLSILKQNYT